MSTATSAQDTIERVYGYYGTALHCVPGGSGEALYACGSGISSVSTAGYSSPASASRYWSLGSGSHAISAIAVHPSGRLVVAAEKRVKVSLMVYSYPNRKKVQDIPDVAKVEVASMVFSRCGQFLAVLSGAPSFSLGLYSVDMENAQLTRFVEATPQFSYPLQHVSFNPLNPEELCATGGGHAVFWHIDHMNGNLLVPTEGTVHVPNLRIQTHVYLPNQDVLCGTDSGLLLRFPHGEYTPTGVVIPRKSNDDGSQLTLPNEPIVALCLTRQHVIACYTTGVIGFFSQYDMGVVVKVFQSQCRRAACMSLTPRCDSVLVGDRKGAINQVVLPGYSDCSDDSEFVLTSPKLLALQHGFGDKIVGVAHLLNTSFAAVGRDGVMSIVDYGSNTIVSRTHVGPNPAFVASVPNSSVVAIANHTGSVRFYNAPPPSQVSNTANSTAASPPPIVSLLLKGCFSESPASFLQATPCGRYVCLGDGQALHYFIVNKTAASSDDMVEFLGTVRLSASTTAVAMVFLMDPADEQNQPMALVSHTSGDTFLMRVPTAATFESLPDRDVPTVEASAAQLLINSWRLDIPVYNFAVAGVFTDYITIIAQSLDKEGRLCLLDRSLNPERKDRESRVIKPQVLFRDFDKKGSYVGFIRNGKYLLTAATDGKLLLRDAASYRSHLSPQPVTKERKDPAVSLHRHVSITGGIGGICFSEENQRIVSAGSGGVIIVWGINLPSSLAASSVVPSSNPLRLQFTPETAASIPIDADETVFFTEKKKNERQELDSLRFQTYRSAIKDRLGNLYKQLRVIREENDSVVMEEERVPLSQFLVDRQQEVFNDAVDGAVLEMQSEMKFANLHRDYVADLIKKEVWDVMEIRLQPLLPLDTAANRTVVNSFHKRIENVSENAIVKKLKFLRLVEIADRKKRKLNELQNVYEDPTDAMDDGGDFDNRGTMTAAAASPASPASPPGTTTATSTITTAAADRPTRVEVGENGENIVVEIDPVEELLSKDANEQAQDDPVAFLYDNLLTFTRARAVIQKLLLGCRIRHVKSGFNKIFMELSERRRAEIHKIDERNVRCRHILKELGEDLEIFAPTSHPKEDPAHVFNVKDEDVLADKAKDPAEKLRLAQAEADRQRWIARHGSDDSSEKALKVWMDGRLDKDIRTLEVNVSMPEFADETSEKYVIAEERSDEQNNLYKDYEQRLAKRVAEVEERRSDLRTEFEGLQGLSRAAAKKFDDEVMRLYAARVVASQGCCRVELQQIKLAQSVVMHSERVRIARTLETRRQLLSDALQRATKASQKATLALESITASVDSLRDQEKQRDRTVRQVHPFNDHEFGDVLMRYNVKKTKAAKRKKEEQQPMINAQLSELAQMGSLSKYSTTMNPTQDPFAFIELHEDAKLRQQDEENAAAVKPLEKPSDLLNVPQHIWDSYNQYRQDRILSERELARLTEEQAEAHGNLTIAEGERARVAVAVSEALKVSDTFLADAVDGVYDIDGIYVLRQGQVEVDTAPVVTDYSDAILIRVEHVERLNKLIRESSVEKVECIQDIMAKRKEIALGEWELDHLTFSIATLEMQLKHLHTLRVTKHMQEFIAGGGEDHNAQQRQKIQAKIQHVRTTMVKKIEERGQQMQKLRRTIKDKEVENYILLDQVDDAKALVDDRRTIRDLQSSDAGSARCDKLMRDMRVTKKLEDVAKAQQSEMVTLRQEIDRLRERTFPSFAVVSKRVVGNPDQI